MEIIFSIIILVISFLITWFILWFCVTKPICKKLDETASRQPTLFGRKWIKDAAKRMLDFSGGDVDTAINHVKTRTVFNSSGDEVSISEYLENCIVSELQESRQR